MSADAFPNILEILSVVDTRTWEEGPDDRFHPIAGSGDPHPCARCGRMHEVHATVKLSDETTAVVGTGCAGKESMESKKRFMRLDRAGKRLAALQAELARDLAHEERWAAARAEVEALEFPPIEETWESFAVGRRKNERFPTLTMGDESVWCEIAANSRTHEDMSPRDRQEREDALRSCWRRKRMEDRGFRSAKPGRSVWTRKEITKVERRIETIREEQRDREE